MFRISFLWVVIFLIFTSCNQQENYSYSFTEIACNPDPTPEFDGKIVTIVGNEYQKERDTIIDKIPKSRTVFKPCRSLIYKASFYSDKDELITESSIKMMASGKRWDYAADVQDEIIIQYEHNNLDYNKNKEYQLNKGLTERQWTFQTTEGIIENENQVWMHPFRYNQFNFTEVAPFPMVRFPLKKDKTWNKSLNIQNGWGDWEHTNGNMSYEVTKKEAITTPYGKINDCWLIKSRSKFPFGSSHFEYWFHEDLGFVKMEYLNYGNQRLIIELSEIHNN